MNNIKIDLTKLQRYEKLTKLKASLVNLKKRDAAIMNSINELFYQFLNDTSLTEDFKNKKLGELLFKNHNYVITETLKDSDFLTVFSNAIDSIILKNDIKKRHVLENAKRRIINTINDICNSMSKETSDSLNKSLSVSKDLSSKFSENKPSQNKTNSVDDNSFSKNLNSSFLSTISNSINNLIKLPVIEKQLNGIKEISIFNDNLFSFSDNQLNNILNINENLNNDFTNITNIFKKDDEENTNKFSNILKNLGGKKDKDGDEENTNKFSNILKNLGGKKDKDGDEENTNEDNNDNKKSFNILSIFKNTSELAKETLKLSRKIEKKAKKILKRNKNNDESESNENKQPQQDNDKQDKKNSLIATPKNNELSSLLQSNKEADEKNADTLKKESNKQKILKNRSNNKKLKKYKKHNKTMKKLLDFLNIFNAIAPVVSKLIQIVMLVVNPIGEIVGYLLGAFFKALGSILPSKENVIKGLLAFLATPAGAYMLGYILGKIYKYRKKIFGFINGVIEGINCILPAKWEIPTIGAAKTIEKTTNDIKSTTESISAVAKPMENNKKGLDTANKNMNALNGAVGPVDKKMTELPPLPPDKQAEKFNNTLNTTKKELNKTKDSLEKNKKETETLDKNKEFSKDNYNKNMIGPSGNVTVPGIPEDATTKIDDKSKPGDGKSDTIIEKHVDHVSKLTLPDLKSLSVIFNKKLKLAENHAKEIPKIAIKYPAESASKEDTKESIVKIIGRRASKIMITIIKNALSSSLPGRLILKFIIKPLFKKILEIKNKLFNSEDSAEAFKLKIINKTIEAIILAGKKQFKSFNELLKKKSVLAITDEKSSDIIKNASKNPDAGVDIPIPNLISDKQSTIKKILQNGFYIHIKLIEKAIFKNNMLLLLNFQKNNNIRKEMTKVLLLLKVISKFKFNSFDAFKKFFKLSAAEKGMINSLANTNSEMTAKASTLYNDNKNKLLELSKKINSKDKDKSFGDDKKIFSDSALSKGFEKGKAIISKGLSFLSSPIKSIKKIAAPVMNVASNIFKKVGIFKKIVSSIKKFTKDGPFTIGSLINNVEPFKALYENFNPANYTASIFKILENDSNIKSQIKQAEYIESFSNLNKDNKNNKDKFNSENTGVKSQIESKDEPYNSVKEKISDNAIRSESETDKSIRENYDTLSNITAEYYDGALSEILGLIAKGLIYDSNSLNNQINNINMTNKNRPKLNAAFLEAALTNRLSQNNFKDYSSNCRIENSMDDFVKRI